MCGLDRRTGQSLLYIDQHVEHCVTLDRGVHGSAAQPAGWRGGLATDQVLRCHSITHLLLKLVNGPVHLRDGAAGRVVGW